MAIHGLAKDVLGRRFIRAEHPRLDIICDSQGPTRFAPNSPLPDPFDGYLEHDRTAALNIHDCLGCPLIVADEVVGVLVADAHRPHTFDRLDDRFLSTLGALASAAFRTTVLVEKLERTAERQGNLANELLRQASVENGGRLIGESPVLRALCQRNRHRIAIRAHGIDHRRNRHRQRSGRKTHSCFFQKRAIAATDLC